MVTPIEYAHRNADSFREQLFDLIRIPSISTDSNYASDVRRAAEWVATNLRTIGATAEVLPTARHPVVYGEWLGAGADAKTVLVYGHYDVQPAELRDGWTNPPFEPIIRNGFVFARGSSDDKGQMFIHIKALESFLRSETGKAPVNVKFLIEGEEEIGSPNLTAFVAANKERLKADVCVISDTGMGEIENPSITYALRGLAYMEIHVSGPEKDLHSGWGGPVHNPAQALAHIIAALHDTNGHILVPGFYDDVMALNQEERDILKMTDYSEAELRTMFGVPAAWGEPNFTLVERQTARPTLEINGIYGGYMGEGSKTVLPAKAVAKVSCRLVPFQKPERIYHLVRDYVASITPPSVKSEVRLLNVGDAVLIPRDDPSMQAAIQAYARGWGKEPHFRRSGGSIPIVADFRRELGLPVLLMGYGLETDGAHGPDEHFSLEMFRRGIDTAICFLEEIGKE
ncbi:MAG: dipeptidase [Chloroflexota bacterium]|nr:dipeptidase [Chloroflexota bacterium]